MDFHVCPMEAWNICAAGVKLYQLQPLCQVAGFHRVAYVELLKDVLSVSVYRVNADVQAFGYLFATFSVGYELQNFGLAFGKRTEKVAW